MMPGTKKTQDEEAQEPNLNENHHCVLCSEPDNTQMVQCDECSVWNHFVCAGVTANVANEDFCCVRCTTRINAAKEINDPPLPVTPLNAGAPAVRKTGQAVVRKQPKVPRIPKITTKKQAGPIPTLLVPDPLNPRNVLPVPKPLPRPLPTPVPTPVLTPMATPIATPNVEGLNLTAAQAQLQLQLLEEEEVLERKYLERRYKLLMATAADPEQVNFKTPAGPKFNSTPISSVHHSVAHLPNVPQHSVVEPAHAALNRDQIAARHAVSKDLPSFNGNPEEWPLFFSTFESSTRICGYTAEENMFRLQKCLHGDAKNAVYSQLLHPANVDSVIATLKMRFGQPQRIVDALIQKVLDLPAPTEKMSTLVDFAVAIRNVVATVEVCELQDYLCNASLLKDLVARLPSMIQLSWAIYLQSLPLQRGTLKDFSEWLYKVAEAANLVAPSATHKTNDSKPRRGRKDNGFINTHREASESPTRKSNYEPRHEGCIVCSSTCESVDKCKTFLGLDHSMRWTKLRELKLCRRCLKTHRGFCKNNTPCGKGGCQFKHHRLLHNDSAKRTTEIRPIESNSKPVATLPPPAEPAVPATTGADCNTHRSASNGVLFRYIPIVLHNAGISVSTFAFLDDGSSVTLMEEELVKTLGLEGEPYPLCLKWTAETCRYEEESNKVSLEISSCRDTRKRFELPDVHTVKHLNLPPQSLAFDKLSEKHQYLRGLPVDSYADVRPKILIGMNYVRIGRNLQTREGGEHDPVASKTRLGWVVYGSCSHGHENPQGFSSHHSFHICQQCSETNDDLHKAVKNFFSLDSLGITKCNKLLSNEDERALAMMRSITTLGDTRYQSGLLWKFDDVRLPDSKMMAMRRTKCLQSRMSREPELAAALTLQIQNYVSKGYARKLSPEELNEPRERVWWMPVFPVFNPNKPGKLRIVWDAAASSGGVSLNDVLMKGPDLTAPLTTVFYGFRQHRVAIGGDIREMFHQVAMNESDQHCQRFFWPNENGTLDVYILTVMSFGAKCSPSIAQFVKNENAERFRNQFPAAVDIIQKAHYVDDMLISVDTEEEGIELTKQVEMIHKAGGFEIRGWVSNSKTVVAALDAQQVSEKSLDVVSEVANEKVLGMWWSTEGDYFTYKVFTDRNKELLLNGKHPTKSEILRILMSIYDPLGLISHYLMYLKILLQDVWRSGIDWNDHIKEREYERWKIWLEFLPTLEIIRIPRCYHCYYQLNPTKAPIDIQLHTFVDASECGYAAVSYFRFECGAEVHVALIGAKSRVAPLKFVSIPRLELQAALIGSRFAAHIIEGHTYKVTKRFFWTDARDVLYWLRSDHRRYSQFVAYRVSEILELTELDEWRWIPTKLNVADDATKWKDSPDMQNDSRWYKGPDFLRQPEDRWPQTPSLKDSKEELRPNAPMLHHFVPAERVLNPTDFSNWNRLVRRMAFILRFPRNIRAKRNGLQQEKGILTQDELNGAAKLLYRQAQEDSYFNERMLLADPSARSGERLLPKNNALYKVEPYLDEDGLMRQRGRISACEYIDEATKHPIILPRDHPVTLLVIQQIHEDYKHCWHWAVLNELRRKFYIPRLRSTYYKVRRGCQYCKNVSAEPQPPPMAEFPIPRLSAFIRPFSYVGVDYFGPMQVVVGRRVEKRWGVLVTCLTVRAVHIEIAHSLTTNSCIMALRNVFSRRGQPIEIRSDRGTNFIGANRELKQAFEQVNQQDLMQEFVNEDTKWVFNPPASPHMGGSWERLIRSVKKFLNITLSTQRIPTDEVLRSTLIEIENIINSRPLTHVPLDDEASPALTPNCFLLGSTSGLKPLVPFDDSKEALRNTWKSSQVLANVFWRKWLAEYLPEITRRTKWFSTVRPIQKGDIVIIVDPDSPRNCWPKGKVIATKEDSKGQVRWATVQSASGVIYDRPAVKLAVLDVGSKGSDPDQGPTTGGTVTHSPSDLRTPQSNTL